ncbi:MAG TPA: L,D-transpeptidase family protein [Sphingomicrobium sp.]|nr:L,D-transpeptidase family protein [Sphingomicrobium sp.]
MLPHSLLTALAGLGLTAAAAPVPIEPVDVPPSVEQGVDMVYVDPEIAPVLQRRNIDGGSFDFDPWTGAPVDMFMPVHPLYTDLRRGLMRYRQRWGDLPPVEIPAGPPIRAGETGERVALLRERLGLGGGDSFDAELGAVVKEYQQVHGLKADGIVANATINSLNLGPDHYLQLLIVNLERARRLPAPGDARRYILVDAGAARLWMYENGVPVDSMKVIVGSKETKTPMMAAVMRYASLNPYWNVPADLTQTLIAPKVVSEGLTYLTERNYEVFADFTEEAAKLDPATVDWRAVADGKAEVRLRRGPGPWNSMGAIKYMMPNDYGIYLHDTPEKALFARDDRWISNGCIRVEDSARLSAWIFGSVPEPRSSQPEERIDLPEPIPVYVTYLTAEATATGVTFRTDRYDRDAAVLARYFGTGRDGAAGGID